MTTRWRDERTTEPGAYDERWRRLEAAGASIHGEADFIAARASEGRVLDAGCGTGRVAIELQRRGIETVGVDNDPAMLDEARQKAPDLRWHDDDLATLALTDARGDVEQFDVIVAAGNVMIFLAPGSEGEVLRRLARHLRPGGELVAGFQVQPNRLTLDRYDDLADQAGLDLVERYATWEGAPHSPDADYAVTVSRRRDEALTDGRSPRPGP